MRTKDPRQALREIIEAHGLTEAFPSEALAEAEAHVASPGLDDPALVDRTDLPFVTIDNEDSRDLDQAVHVAASAAGGFLVSYALADASWYVRPGSALFAEALRRGASYYLPGYCVPMLPRVLSEDRVSLNEGQLRRALLFRMHVDATGRCTGTTLERARIRSRAKLSYDGVQAYYDAPAASPLAGQPFSASLDALLEVGRLRIAEARARHVVRYNRTNLEVRVDGLRFVAVGDVRNDTERYNEQISLLCNTEGARLLSERSDDPDVQAVFRVHPTPEDARLDALARTIDALVDVRHLDAKRWLWRRGEPLASYLDRLPDRGPDERRLMMAIQRQALLVNHRSTFAAEPGLHFGVGAPCYSRFSSPMREVVGVFTHKEALETLLAPDEAAPAAADEVLRTAVVEAANRAKETQRSITKASNKLVIDALLGDDLTDRGDERAPRVGTVVGVARGRAYVQLDDPPVELKLYTRDVCRAWGCAVAVDDDGVALVGDARALRLGDQVEIRVAGYDERRDRWELHPVT